MIQRTHTRRKTIIDPLNLSVVAQGHQLPTPPAAGRRALTATQSLSALPWPAPHSAALEYANVNIIAQVYSGQEDREVRPFGACTSSSSLTFNAGAPGTTSTHVEHVQEADGFDMDEVFGESSGSAFNFGTFGHAPGKLAQPAGFGNPVYANEMAARGSKRSLNTGAVDDEDAEMETTDVEDEGEAVAEMGSWGTPAPVRALAGRRQFKKTMSLPVGHSVFSTSETF